MEKQEHSYKPNRQAFCSFRYLTTLFTSFYLLTIIFLFLRSFTTYQMWWFGIPAAFLLLINLSRWVLLPIRYRKEEYIFKTDRIIAKKGSLFSSSEQELLIKNITHLTMTLPFIEHKLYGTGTIMIQSAGGEDVEVLMSSIDKPQAMYDKIVALMRSQGFQLEQGMTLREGRPSLLGVFMEMIFTMGIAGLVGLFFLGVLIGAISDPKNGLQLVWRPETPVLIALIVLPFLITFFFLFGLARNRRYRILEDTILSETSFYEFQRTMIPMQNLADSALTQHPLARVFGLSHLTLSCQGSNKEITFQHLEEGAVWKEELDGLLKARAAKRSAERRAKEEAKKEAKSSGFQAKARKMAEREEGFTAQFKPDLRFVFLSTLTLFFSGFVFSILGAVISASVKPPLTNNQPTVQSIIGASLLLLGGLLILGSGVRFLFGFLLYKTTSYEIKEMSFAKDWAFLAKKHVVFQAEKITGVLIKQGPLERFFGCTTVSFWSVGASDSLDFTHIRHDDQLLESIQAKVGIYPKREEHKLPIHSSFFSQLRANLFLYLFFMALTPIIWHLVPLALSGIVGIIVLHLLYANLHYRYNFFSLYDDYLVFQKGIFFRTRYLIRYDDVKYFASMRYPLDHCGTLTVDVTGERVIETDNGKQIQSNRFDVHYVPQIVTQHLALDQIMAQEIELKALQHLRDNPREYTPKILEEAKPRFAQMITPTLIGLTLLNVLVLGGIFVMFFTRILPNAADFHAIRQNEPHFYTMLTWGIVGLLVFTLFILLWRIFSIRAMSYHLDTQKVCSLWGLFYKHKLGIHYRDIDYIGKKQFLFNQIFSTANITINTIGSSQTDLTLEALPNAQRFYDLLKERYRPEEE